MRLRNHCRERMQARALRLLSSSSSSTSRPSGVRTGAKRQRPRGKSDSDRDSDSDSATPKKPRGADEPVDPSPSSGGRCFSLLQAAFAPEDQLSETSWLTGTLIDLALWNLAQLYPAVHFLPTAFVHLHLQPTSRSRRSSPASSPAAASPVADDDVRDILGREVDYSAERPLVFLVNVGSIHWNLFRVQFSPTPKLQLFEPMGRLASRAGISYRSVPRGVIEWLERVYPQHGDWLARTESAITQPQQVSGFDCGVACLLYADKCGRGHSGEEINAQTTQRAITLFRAELRAQLQRH